MSHEIHSRPQTGPHHTPVSNRHRHRTLQSACPTIGINQVSAFRWELDEAVGEFQRMGADSIGLWRPRVDDYGHERTLELLRDHQLRISTLSWAGGFTGSNGLSHREAIVDSFEAVDLAAQLGAPVLRVATGGRNFHTENHLRRIVVDGLRRVGDRALEHDVTLAVTPMHRVFAPHWTYLSSIDQTFELLDSVNHPAVQMGLPLAHVGHEPDLLPTLRSHVSQIACVQISDTDGEQQHEADQCLPGQGILPLKETIGQLLESGYTGSLEIDVWSDRLWAQDDPGADLQQSLSSLRSLCVNQ